MSTKVICVAWALAAVSMAGCTVSTGDDSPVAEQVSAIKESKLVGPNDLTGIVKVRTWRGNCTGMIISETAVLTAAHCLCSENYSGGNVCTGPVDYVVFRDGSYLKDIPTSSIVFAPGYNPAWSTARIENDLAIIHIPFGSRPSWAMPFTVGSSYVPIGSQLIVAGYGDTGSACTASYSSLNWDYATLGAYEYDGNILQTQDDEWCNGDSGGALLLANGTSNPTKLVGVISSSTPVFGTNKGMTAWAYYGWIAANVPDLGVTTVPKFTQQKQDYSNDFGEPSSTEAISGDFNGDGLTDYARIGPDRAWVFTAQLGSGFTSAVRVYSGGLWFGSDWKTISGDFNGDGRADYARVGGTGAWVFSGQSGGGFTQTFQGYQGGLNFGQPSSWETITGDFNGDGATDYARVGADQAWFFLGPRYGTWSQGWQYYNGLNFGQPSSWHTITADFNGDRKTDYARLGPTGAWVFTVQPNGSFSQDFQTYTGGLNFGLPSQWEPITGDFNGDGRVDYGRVGATGAWLFISTTAGFTQTFQTYSGLDFGLPSAWKTITGDFNGDGKADYARLGATGAWIFSGSTYPFETVFQPYTDGVNFGLPSQYQTVTGKFNGGTKGGYARLGGTKAYIFRGL